MSIVGVENFKSFPPQLLTFKFYFFRLTLFNTIPTVWTIFVEFLFATPFPNAFPPTVNAATKALNINCKSKFNPNCSVIFIDINALIAPLNTPHISPTTSAHIFATFGAFLINLIELFDPFTFLVAFAWNSFSSATVTATPIISNPIPTNITNSKIKIAGIRLKFVIPFEDMNEKTIDKINVVKNIFISHPILNYTPNSGVRKKRS